MQVLPSPGPGLVTEELLLRLQETQRAFTRCSNPVTAYAKGIPGCFVLPKRIVKGKAKTQKGFTHRLELVITEGNQGLGLEGMFFFELPYNVV